MLVVAGCLVFLGLLHFFLLDRLGSLPDEAAAQRQAALVAQVPTDQVEILDSYRGSGEQVYLARAGSADYTVLFNNNGPGGGIFVSAHPVEEPAEALYVSGSPMEMDSAVEDGRLVLVRSALNQNGLAMTVGGRLLIALPFLVAAYVAKKKKDRLEEDYPRIEEESSTPPRRSREDL